MELNNLKQGFGAALNDHDYEEAEDIAIITQIAYPATAKLMFKALDAVRQAQSLLTGLFIERARQIA